MRKHPRPFHKLRGLRPLATFCALGALVFLLAFLGETQPAARQVAPIPPGGEVRLFEEQDGLCLLAYSGQAPGTSALYALDTATGETLSNYVSFQGTLVWARQRGSSLFAVEHSAAGYTLHQFALPNFGIEPIHSRLLSGVSEDTFAVFDCDGEGRFFYANGLLMTGSVQDSSLSVVQAGGSMVSGVSFLEVTPQGTLVAAAAGQLYVGSAASPGQWKAIPAGDIAPLFLVGENYMAATDGRLYRLGGGSLSPVGSAPLASGQLCAVDQEGRLVYGSGGTVQITTGARASAELDIRGLETLEAESVVENYLDAAQRSKLGTVTIIHGKGTGALRAAVHQMLKKNRAVKSFRLGRYGEGEAGVTVVELK